MTARIEPERTLHSTACTRMRARARRSAFSASWAKAANWCQCRLRAVPLGSGCAQERGCGKEACLVWLGLVWLLTGRPRSPWPRPLLSLRRQEHSRCLHGAALPARGKEGASHAFRQVLALCTKTPPSGRRVIVVPWPHLDLSSRQTQPPRVRRIALCPRIASDRKKQSLVST